MTAVEQILAGIVTALVVARAGAWYGRRRARADLRKVEADTDQSEASAAKTVVDTAMELLEPLRQQIAEQRSRIEGQQVRLDRQAEQLGEARLVATACHRRLDGLELHVDELEARMRAAGLEPPPRPEPEIPT